MAYVRAERLAVIALLIAEHSVHLLHLFAEMHPATQERPAIAVLPTVREAIATLPVVTELVMLRKPAITARLTAESVIQPAEMEPATQGNP
jgi:hypothetical protein